MSPSAHCPHCLLLVEADADASFPPVPMRCPHCRLSIAPGRARHDVSAADAAATGSAAGVLASAARRDDGVVVSTGELTEALRTAAEQVGVAMGRLRMLDYQRVREARPDLPDLASIIESCGGWKRARQLAVSDLSAQRARG